MKTLRYLFNAFVATFVFMAILGANPARAVDFHCATAQDVQNSLTTAAANGANNVIWITNGYYIGNFNYNSSGGLNLAITNEPGVINTQIIFDGAGLGRALSISNSGAGTIAVSGITFSRNCGNNSIGALRIAAGNSATALISSCQFLSPTNTSGMGLEMVSGLNVTVTNCVAIGASTGNGGTGMSIEGITGDVTMQNCTISTNSNTYGVSVSGAGIISISGNYFTGNQGGFSGSATTVLIVSNIFNGNNTFGGAGCSGTTVNVMGNTFINNSYTYYGGGGGGGGGANCIGQNIKLSDNNFDGNSANGYNAGVFQGGGGAYCSGTNIIVINNVFINNSCPYGGGLLCGDTGSGNAGYASVIISENSFTGNLASGYGGGLFCYAWDNYYEPPMMVFLTNNIFTGNSAGLSGGGAYLVGIDGVSVMPNVSANVFNQNSAGTGAGIYINALTVALQDNLIAGNSQTSATSQGGGVWVDATSNLFMINNTITANTAAGSGGGAAFEVTGTVELLNVYNNIIWGNSASGNGADVWLAGTGQKKVFEYNDVNNMYGVWDIALNDINLAPQFFNPIGGDYHFPESSPCANDGTNGVAGQPLTDMDGNIRTNSLGEIDLGCYEFNNTAMHPADTNATYTITAGEFAAYAAAWKSGQTWTNAPPAAPNPNPIQANYVTRAGYLMTNGLNGAYTNDGSARPTNWKPIP